MWVISENGMHIAMIQVPGHGKGGRCPLEYGQAMAAPCALREILQMN